MRVWKTLWAQGKRAFLWDNRGTSRDGPQAVFAHRQSRGPRRLTRSRLMPILHHSPPTVRHQAVR